MDCTGFVKFIKPGFLQVETNPHPASQAWRIPTIGKRYPGPVFGPSVSGF